MVGVNGKAVVTYKKPDVGKEYPIKTFPTSDEFENTTLGMQWGWNHNPDPAKWSLTQNPGHLRLSTVKVVDHLTEARNTLTQRMFAYYSDTVATVAAAKMDFGHIKEGDIAGLAIFQDPYAYIGIKKMNGRTFVIMVNNGQTVDSVAVDASTIYFRAEALYGSGAAPYYGGDAVPGTGTAWFSYSIDNQSFIKFGNELLMKFNLSVFTGNKFCLFNYPTKALGGYVDVDWFQVTPVEKKDQETRDGP
jgi:beta-xylosidase